MRFISAVLAICVIGGQAWSAPAYPLRVAGDSRRVVDQSGQEMFFTAESAWHLLMRLTREEAVQYLDDRQERGFNAILVMLVVATGYHGTSDNVYGDPPFLKIGDFSKPNEAYFAHADWVLRQAAARGFTVLLAPAYLGYQCGDQGWCKEMKRSGMIRMRQWGRFVGSRYRDFPNIIWLDGGDCDAGEYGARKLVDAVAYGIRDVDPQHLHAAHASRYHSAADCYDRPWLDINTTYADCVQAPRELQADQQRGKRRPFVYIEGRYEAEKDWTMQCVRSQAYWALLGGAVGHCFGNGIIWGYSAGWQEAMASDGARSMAHFRSLMHSRAWELLIPDYEHKVLTDGYGDINTSAYAAAARTVDGKTVIIYAPTARVLTVAMDQIEGTKARVWWFDPGSGEHHDLGSFPTTGLRVFTPPSNADWVLVLDDVAAGFGPPGGIHGENAPPVERGE